MLNMTASGGGTITQCQPTNAAFTGDGRGSNVAVVNVFSAAASSRCDAALRAHTVRAHARHGSSHRASLRHACAA
jgi:hypothetical protein